ncbi:MAG: ORF6N domain-containing protein [Bacteroidales bacterium]
MTENKGNLIIPEELISQKIYIIRNSKVMLDRDLADLFDVRATRLREQVKRNHDKFPLHFMFQLSDSEVDIMVSQNAIPSRQHLGGSLPFVFTEHGVLQLANVLKSKRATQVSIRIIEIFVKMREILATTLNIQLDIEMIKNKLDSQDQKIVLLFNYLNELMEKPDSPEPRNPVGFKRKGEQ